MDIVAQKFIKDGTLLPSDKQILGAMYVLRRSLFLLGLWAPEHGPIMPKEFTNPVYTLIYRNPMTAGMALELVLRHVKELAGKDPADRTTCIALDEEQQEYVRDLNKHLWEMLGRDNDPCERLFR